MALTTISPIISGLEVISRNLRIAPDCRRSWSIEAELTLNASRFSKLCEFDRFRIAMSTTPVSSKRTTCHCGAGGAPVVEPGRPITDEVPTTGSIVLFRDHDEAVHHRSARSPRAKPTFTAPPPQRNFRGPGPADGFSVGGIFTRRRILQPQRGRSKSADISAVRYLTDSASRTLSRPAGSIEVSRRFLFGDGGDWHGLGLLNVGDSTGSL